MAHRGGRFRFSLATLMLAVVGLAVLLTVWKAVTYEPFTHRFSAYEKAEGTRGKSITVGPTEVSLVTIARNDRDGRILFSDGRGGPATQQATANRLTLVDSAPWLDMVEIELAPADRIDVIEARLFNHKTREWIGSDERVFNWQMAAPNVLQVYGIGNKLPDDLDVWFRAQSYPANDDIVTLANKLGSQCKLPGGTVTLVDARDNFWGYTSAAGLVKVGSPQEGTTILINWKGKWGEVDYQIAAVSKTAEKSHTHGFHFLRMWDKETRHVFFDMPLDEVDHFEFRPFGGRHVFFFEAVKLPKTSTVPFAKPPTFRADVGGREMEATPTEFLPLDFRVRTQRGEQLDGDRLEASSKSDSGFTLSYESTGQLKPTFRLFDRNSSELMLKPSRSISQSGGSHQIQSQGSAFYEVSLERIGSMEVSFETAPSNN
jgi:hypothetical protein